MNLTAFGETKPLADWLADPRCTVSYATLCGRLRLGWPASRAISEPVRSLVRASRRRTRASLDRQNRIVVPAWALQHLGLQEGDSLAVEVTDEAIILVPQPWT